MLTERALNLDGPVHATIARAAFNVARASRKQCHIRSEKKGDEADTDLARIRQTNKGLTLTTMHLHTEKGNCRKLSDNHYHSMPF